MIEDYAEVETAERSFAFILFKQEQRRMMKVYFASKFGWTDWFATAEGVPQGGRGRLETDGESVTVSAADRNGGLRTDVYKRQAYDRAKIDERMQALKTTPLDAHRPVATSSFRLPQGDYFLSEVWRYGRDRLENALKNIFENGNENMTFVLLIINPHHMLSLIHI